MTVSQLEVLSWCISPPAEFGDPPLSKVKPTDSNMTVSSILHTASSIINTDLDGNVVHGNISPLEPCSDPWLPLITDNETG